MNYLKNTFWFWFIGLVVLALIAWIIYYEYKYPCVRGHYEKQWQYITNANGTVTPYLTDVFICDCRTIRDSLK